MIAGSRFLVAGLIGVGALQGCGALGVDEGERLRLEGEVLRGPISPVCFQVFSCDAPFSAGFGVYLGTRLIRKFRSDDGGRFSVSLPAGRYQVIPDDDAPIMSPRDQAREVTVGPDSVTRVTLKFDTGIR